MSRLTSTEVIHRGEYLEPEFDPMSLTVPHLLSILTLHAVKYPTPYSKSKLVQAFNDEIKPRIKQLKKERLKREGSVASSHGIVDGITGESMSDDAAPPPQPPPRRSSRRLSRPPSQTPSPTKPEPPKRRRSSAGPSLSRTSSRIVEPVEPALLEESEPEEKPAKKVVRPRKSAAAAGPQGRRVSQTEDVDGWSDNNVFQSGAESSSPARPSPSGRGALTVRRPIRRGRTSFSAPPQVPSSSPFAAPPTSHTFDPELPVAAKLPRRNLRAAQGTETTNGALKLALRHMSREVEMRSSSPLLEEEYEDAVDPAERSFGDDEVLDEDVKFNTEVSKALANGGSQRVVGQRNVSQSQGVFSWARIALGAITLALLTAIASYKVQSATIGYCYPGTDTNAILGERKAARLAAQECTERLANQSGNDHQASNVTCTPLPLLTLSEPMACAPCPAHAYCTPDMVTCEPSFVLRQHPLAKIPFLPQLFDGMPGLGPVAFPPSCVEDEERKRNIGRLGVALENYLALTRGHRVCVGLTRPAGDGGEAAQLGLQVERVHDHLKKITVIQKNLVKADEFEGLFDQAIADLQRFGYVLMDQDSSGATYIAAVRIHLDLPCKIRVVARNTWNEWKGYVFASLLLIISAYWTKGKIAARQMESRRVGDLVQVALDRLRNQELAHHTDPVSTPHIYLSSLHLRDVILQDEHSIPARRRLWDKVEKIVEGNTNVRASVEELIGGDEGRVWRWVGGAHRNNIKSQ
ncbi:Man1-Src1p-C-terminal domain-containing protein [Gautieria morchelliformis]|nr:Man1-Src1p-C-terminal domain-containing protein [Gautieria morchelliformis]